MKFIHLADVHLGAAPDRGFPWSQEREEEIWETFRRVIAGIRENPVDFLFIAGDLFHRQPLLRELKEVNYLFSTIPETRVFLMAGNHDYMKRDSFYRTFSWGPNVVLFKGEQVTCVEEAAKGVSVYGLSYEHQEILSPLYDSVQPRPGEGIHILMAHGGDERHIPLRAERLLANGFDYVALGHIHKPQVLKEHQAAYSGALEPLDRNDMGPHGYIEGTVDGGRIRTRFVPFACRSYGQIGLTVSEETTQLSLEERLENEVQKRGYRNIYRVILDGVKAPDFFLLPEKLKVKGNIVEVLDRTRPAYDLEELKKHYSGTLIGDYIEFFMAQEQTEVREKALYYGLQALLETGR